MDVMSYEEKVKRLGENLRNDPEQLGNALVRVAETAEQFMNGLHMWAGAYLAKNLRALPLMNVQYSMAHKIKKLLPMGLSETLELAGGKHGLKVLRGQEGRKSKMYILTQSNFKDFADTTWEQERGGEPKTGEAFKDHIEMCKEAVCRDK